MGVCFGHFAILTMRPDPVNCSSFFFSFSTLPLLTFSCSRLVEIALFRCLNPSSVYRSSNSGTDLHRLRHVARNGSWPFSRWPQGSPHRAGELGAPRACHVAAGAASKRWTGPRRTSFGEDRRRPPPVARIHQHRPDSAGCQRDRGRRSQRR